MVRTMEGRKKLRDEKEVSEERVYIIYVFLGRKFWFFNCASRCNDMHVKGEEESN